MPTRTATTRAVRVEPPRPTPFNPRSSHRAFVKNPGYGPPSLQKLPRQAWRDDMTDQRTLD